MTGRLDVNVILDALADRPPWADSAAEVLGCVERGEATGCLAAHTVTPLYDLLSRQRNADLARRHIRLLLRLFKVVAVDENRPLPALALSLPDYEDAVQAACAEKAGG